MNQLSTRATRHADFLFSPDGSLYRCLNVHFIPSPSICLRSSVHLIVSVFFFIYGFIKPIYFSFLLDN